MGDLTLNPGRCIFGVDLPGRGDCCAKGKALRGLTAAQRRHTGLEVVEMPISKGAILALRWLKCLSVKDDTGYDCFSA